MSSIIHKLNLKKYKIMNNLKDELNENQIFLHWLRYHKQNIIFRPKQIYISDDLNHFKRIKIIYNLHHYYSRDIPALFFGIYNENDLNTIIAHKGDRYIIWGGTDCDIRFQKHRDLVSKVIKIPVIKHYAISQNIYDRLNRLGIKCEKINLNLTHTDYFKPLEKKGEAIYIYNGYEKGNEHIYGEEEYSYITKKFDKFIYIHSHGMKIPYTKMANIYEKCFIGLRLTQNDGNANTVTEMKNMGLSVVHNGDFKNTLHWNNTQDIITHIHNEYFKKEKVNNSILDINNMSETIDDVLNDVRIINRYIKQYKSILFICSDYPGWGGAATNCYNLIKYYKDEGFNVKGIFWTWSKKELKSLNINDYDIKLANDIIFTTKNNLNNTLEKLSFNPDLVILRNLTYVDVNNFFNCPIFLFLPGLFTDSLNKNSKLLNTKSKFKKYLNNQLYLTMKRVDLIFVNNYNTQKLLKKYLNINSVLFYFNLITYLRITKYNENEIEKREYDYGIIVSDFKRKIKNIPETINKLNGKILLIGKNSDLIKDEFRDKNIVNMPLISNIKVKKQLKKIKTVILNSHYEGCSNVLIEGYYAGCKIKYS